MGGRNTVLLDALSWRIPLVSDIPTIIFGADVTHPESGEDSCPSIAAVRISKLLCTTKGCPMFDMYLIGLRMWAQKFAISASFGEGKKGVKRNAEMEKDVTESINE